MWRGPTRRVEHGRGGTRSSSGCSSGETASPSSAPARADQVDSKRDSDGRVPQAEADRAPAQDPRREAEPRQQWTQDRDADSPVLRWPEVLLFGGHLRPWHILFAVFILVQLYIATRAHVALHYDPPPPGPGGGHWSDHAKQHSSEEPDGEARSTLWQQPGNSLRRRLLLDAEPELLHCQGDVATHLSHSRQLLSAEARMAPHLSHSRQLLSGEARMAPHVRHAGQEVSVEEGGVGDAGEGGVQGSRRRLLGRTRLKKKLRRLRKKKAPSEVRKRRLKRAALANASRTRSTLSSLARSSLPRLLNKALPRSHKAANRRGANATTGVLGIAFMAAKVGPAANSTAYTTEATVARRRLSSFAKDGVSVAAQSGHLDMTLAQLLRQRFESCILTERLNPNVYWKVCGNQLRKDNRSVVIYSFSAGAAKDANLTQFQREFRSYGHKVISFNPLSARQQPGQQSEAQAEEVMGQEEAPEDPDGGPLLAKLATKPFGLGLYDGVKPAVKPIVAEETAQSAGIQDASALSLASKEFLVEPHNDTGLQVPMLRLKTLMCIFRHAWVDVVQLDLGGAEIELCDARGGLLGAGTLAGARRSGWAGGIPVGQFVVKFNEGVIKEGQKRRHRCEKHMDSAGYKVAHRRPDNRMVVFARMGLREGKATGKGKRKTAKK